MHEIHRFRDFCRRSISLLIALFLCAESGTLGVKLWWRNMSRIPDSVYDMLASFLSGVQAA